MTRTETVTEPRTHHCHGCGSTIRPSTPHTVVTLEVFGIVPRVGETTIRRSWHWCGDCDRRHDGPTP